MRISIGTSCFRRPRLQACRSIFVVRHRSQRHAHRERAVTCTTVSWTALYNWVFRWSEFVPSAVVNCNSTNGLELGRDLRGTARDVIVSGILNTIVLRTYQWTHDRHYTRPDSPRRYRCVALKELAGITVREGRAVERNGVIGPYKVIRRRLNRQSIQRT